jgi:N-acetyl-D-muramate 6-phosphate phosphatase
VRALACAHPPYFRPSRLRAKPSRYSPGETACATVLNLTATTANAFEPSRVRAVIFDVDGTLRDTDDELVAAVERQLQRFAALLPGRRADRLARRLVMRFESPANLLFDVPNLLRVAPIVNRVAERLTKPRASAHFRLVPGVPEMLQSLSGRYTLAVVSAGLDRATRQFLKAAGIETHFRRVATLGTCSRTKPCPDPLLWVARELGLSPEHCVMVGDTTVDIRAGRSAGAQTIGVLCGFGEESELRQAGASLIIATTAALAEVLAET